MHNFNVYILYFGLRVQNHSVYLEVAISPIFTPQIALLVIRIKGEKKEMMPNFYIPSLSIWFSVLLACGSAVAVSFRRKLHLIRRDHLHILQGSYDTAALQNTSYGPNSLNTP